MPPLQTSPNSRCHSYERMPVEGTGRAVSVTDSPKSGRRLVASTDTVGVGVFVGVGVAVGVPVAVGVAVAVSVGVGVGVAVGVHVGVGVAVAVGVPVGVGVGVAVGIIGVAVAALQTTLTVLFENTCRLLFQGGFAVRAES